MNHAKADPRRISTGFVRLTIALLASTLALIALGGLVRITGSGLGCPDWPLCHGSIIPPFELAPWIEYMHRLAAASVSVLVLLYTALAWWRYRAHGWLLAPAILAPLLPVVQARMVVTLAVPGSEVQVMLVALTQASQVRVVRGQEASSS
jgi:heme A synthase